MRFDMDAKTLQHNQMKQAKTFAILRRSAAVQLLSKHNDVWQGFVLRCAIDDLWMTSLKTVQASPAIVVFAWWQEVSIRVVILKEEMDGSNLSAINGV